jgi:outer membrane protein assembly factor BamB
MMSARLPESLVPADPDARYQLAVRVVAVGMMLALLVGGIMFWEYNRRLAKDPLESPQFKALKAKLVADPKNDYLKTEIRELDLQLRESYFRQRSLAARGTWLMLVGMVGALVCARWAATLHRKLPQPQPNAVPSDPEIRINRFSRWSVLGFSIVLGSVTFALSRSFSSELPPTEEGLVAMLHPPAVAAVPSTPAAAPIPVRAPTATVTPAPSPAAVAVASALPATPAPAAATAAAVASDEETAKNWPRFRGPGGLGISNESGFVTTWNAKSGKNILWKSAVPLTGNNSPILWGDRIFMSGADDQKRQVYCFDAAAGKLLWQQDVPVTTQGAGKVKVSNDTGMAASTMATDGHGVYAMFPNGDAVGFDFTGKQLWLRGFGMPKNEYGHASSLLTYKNLLLIQFDQGEPSAKLSKLMALEGASGKTVWETPRPAPNCWATPIVIHAGGRDQIITSGDPFAIAYDPADGKEIWRAKCLRQDIGPSPVFAAGLVFVASEFPCLSAIKPDGAGDVTATHIVWKGEDGLPDTCSPLATDQYVVLLSTPGTVTCYDVKQGKKYWEKDFDSEFRASPTMAGGRVYLIGAEGKAWVIELGNEGCKEVGTAELGENCVASPLFHAGRMYLRGKDHLYCIGGK